MDGGGGRGGLGRRLAALGAGLRCSPAEAVAVCLLVFGAFVGLGLLWLLASPHLRPPPPPLAVEGVVAAEGPAATRAAPEGGGAGTGPPGSAGAGAADAGAAGSGAVGAGEVGEPVAGAGGGARPGGAASAGEVVVHVAGRVGSPGVYRLAAGSRVAEAVEAAGGALGDADVDALNLARALVDGEQVRVPAVGEALAPPPGDGPSGGGARLPDGALDLNLAALDDLDELPGVGPVLAQRILDHRAKIGRFTTVEELRDVKGIGEATYAELAPEVSV